MLDVVKRIHAHGKLSRTDLIEQTGYSAFLIAKMCDRLLAAGFICETGQGNSTGGRPPTLISINPDLGRLVGLHIGTVHARLVVTDMLGTALVYRKIPSHVQTDPEIALSQLATLVDEGLKQSNISPEQIRGIGIGISGVLDRSTGSTLFWPKVPQWVNVPVKSFFETRFNTVVEVEDTPRTMALAERRFSSTGEVSEFVFIAVGAGTGAALFLRNQLYTGAGGFAGEFGHMTVDDQGPLCSCGNRGCLEATISASALIRRAQNAVVQGLSTILWRLTAGDPSSVSIELIAEAASQGDRFSLSILRDAGSFLGLGIVSIANLLNPNLVVIGGGLAVAAGPYLLPAARQIVHERAFERQAAQMRIELSTLSEVDWARGAALLVTDRALEATFLVRRESKIA
jgi:predicted NBD/HSP70 family sugar kinase